MTTTTLTPEIMWPTCFRHCTVVCSTYNLDKHQKWVDCGLANQDAQVVVHHRLCHTLCHNTFTAHQHKCTVAQQTTQLSKISTLQKHNVSQLCRHHSVRCPPPWRHPRLHGHGTLQEVSVCSLVCGTSWRWPQGCTNSSHRLQQPTDQAAPDICGPIPGCNLICKTGQALKHFQGVWSVWWTFPEHSDSLPLYRCLH